MIFEVVQLTVLYVLVTIRKQGWADHYNGRAKIERLLFVANVQQAAGQSDVEALKHAVDELKKVGWSWCLYLYLSL